MSLASQAVGPPLSDFEMACAGKRFADIGRKILPRRALSTQKIAATDGVLGAGPLGNLRSSAGPGLRPTYREMVQNAFQPRLWEGLGTHAVSGDTLTPTPAPAGFTQAELNFSLFFGLAVDAYERTLISDDTPFDRGLAPGSAAQRGREVFEGKGKCTACHVGPLLSGAAVPPRQRQELVERMAMGDGGRRSTTAGSTTSACARPSRTSASARRTRSATRSPSPAGRRAPASGSRSTGPSRRRACATSG
jgi:hypothetical protein